MGPRTFSIYRAVTESREATNQCVCKKAHCLCTKLEHRPLSASLTNGSSSSFRWHSERRRLCDRRTSNCRLGSVCPPRSSRLLERCGCLGGSPQPFGFAC